MFARPHFSLRLLICRFADVRWQAAIAIAIVLTLESVHQSVHLSISHSAKQADSGTYRLQLRAFNVCTHTYKTSSSTFPTWAFLAAFASDRILSNSIENTLRDERNVWVYSKIYIDSRCPLQFAAGHSSPGIAVSSEDLLCGCKQAVARPLTMTMRMPQQFPSLSAGTDSPKRCKRNAAKQNIANHEYPVKRNVLFIRLTWSKPISCNDNVYT